MFCLSLFTIACTYCWQLQTVLGISDYFGSIKILNSNDSDLNENILQAYLETNCSGQTIEARNDRILEYFPCLISHPLLPSITAITLSALFFEFDSDDTSCINNPTVNLDNFCIFGVVYDRMVPLNIDVSGECTTRNIGANTLPAGYSWALDRLNGIPFDAGMWEYFSGPFVPEVVDLFIVDSGIRGTHEEFNGRVIDHSIGGNPPFFNSPNRGGFDHGTQVASAAGGFWYGSSRGQTIHNYNVGMYFQDYNVYAPSRAYTDTALIQIRDYLEGFGIGARRGVINMSFGCQSCYTAQEIEFRDELHEVKST